MLSLAAGCLAQTAWAQTSSSEGPKVSPRALALAKTIHDQPITAATLDNAAKSLASRLLNTAEASRGMSCDPRDIACRTAADQIAREFAPKAVEATMALRDQQLAIILESKMTDDQIGRSLDFVRTSTGRSLAAALTASPASLPPQVLGKFADAALNVPPPTFYESAVERFYRETRGLPRRPTPLGPPAPIAPRTP